MSSIQKYRGWNSVEKKFVYFTVGELLMHCQSSPYSRFENVDFDKVQQFTGLRGGSGREIYDGDVLEDTVSNDGGRYKVQWGDDGWYLVAIAPDWSIDDAIAEEAELRPRLAAMVKFTKVIGDIITTPELLDEQV